jgi:type VI secretion system protein ImpA
MRALRETPRDWLAAQLLGARQAQEALLAWQHQIDQHLGAEGPGFVPAKEALATWMDEFERLARDMGVGVNGASEDGGALQAMQSSLGVSSTAMPPQEDPVALHAAARMPGPVQTRAQALQQLREVSAFFKRTEPHSPVAYLADKAVAWAEMPLHEWLRRVVKDQGSMSHLQELLGIEPEAPPPY